VEDPPRPRFESWSSYFFFLTTHERVVLLLSIANQLVPARKDAGFRMAGYHVWDGSIIEADGAFHLFASRWPESTGFPDGYRTRSEIVRAIADNPSGPYVFQETVLAGRGAGYWDGKMCHNPKIVKAGDTFVLYYIGSALDSPLRKIGYAWSTSIDGPWNRLPRYMPFTRDANNPAPLVHGDGSILLAFRDQKLQVHVARANRFDGKYRIIAKNIFRDKKVEDPDIILVDGHYHMIAEDNGGRFTGHPRFGAHFTSRDGKAWSPFDPVQAYTFRIECDDGTVLVADRRERPELFTSGAAIKGHGLPTHLVTAIKVGESTRCHVQQLSLGH
jgi:hypothetical protein